MVLKTNKGEFCGTLEECAEWLEEYQPSVARIGDLDLEACP